MSFLPWGNPLGFRVYFVADDSGLARIVQQFSAKPSDFKSGGPKIRLRVKSDGQLSRYKAKHRGHLTSAKRPQFLRLEDQKSYLERETGLEPATLCLGRLSSAISPGNEPLSPEAVTLKLQTIIRPDPTLHRERRTSIGPTGQATRATVAIAPSTRNDILFISAYLELNPRGRKRFARSPVSPCGSARTAVPA